MEVKITLKDDRLRNLPRNLRKKGRAHVLNTAGAIEGQAKVLCPVDTGALRASIMVTETGEMSAEVGPHMNYSEFVEYGTVHQQAQPYLTPAAEGARPQWETGLKDLFGE